MKLVLQRVSRAAVTIDGNADAVGIPGRREIGHGLMILAGFSASDTAETVAFMADKAVKLRIFDDENGQINRSLLDVGGGCLVVSNFTLYANCRKGRRPSFVDAAPPTVSEPLYRRFVEALGEQGIAELQTGEFGADMRVEIINDGPVTILLDSEEIMPVK